MIGISEGIVLADRYRLARRQVERGIGATWVAADIETGADVWVQFADQGGLADAAQLLRRHRHPAMPDVLDTGELRLIVDSRAVAVDDGREAPRATHVEIVIEFVVLRPLTGRALPAKIVRKALSPAEALVLVAGLAGALELASGEGRSHGWLTADSVWLARRGGYVIDLALGLAFPDGTRIETEQQVTGYFAPERLAGGSATEAADVFALGWVLYEALIGHAALRAEYARLVAGASAVTTIELLALWRERARRHVVELMDANSPLALLLTACLAERAADRPSLGAFTSGARDTATQWAGVGPLVELAARPRPERSAVVAGTAESMAVVSDEVAAALVIGSALGLEATGADGTSTEGISASEGVGGAEEATAAQATAETAEAVDVDEVSAEETSAAGAIRHGRRRQALATTVAASIAAIFIIGLVIGYEWGHNGGSSSSSATLVGAAGAGSSAAPSSGTGSVAVAAAVASPSAACATPAPSASASASALASPAPSSSAPESPSASVSASAAPLTRLSQIVRAAESSGGITSSTASRLNAAIGKAQAATVGSGAWNSALSNLSTLIQNGQSQGSIPTAVADELATALSYLYGSTGS